MTLTTRNEIFRGIFSSVVDVDVGTIRGHFHVTADLSTTTTTTATINENAVVMSVITILFL